MEPSNCSQLSNTTLGGDCSQMLEEAISCPPSDDRLMPGEHGKSRHRVERECQKIERDQNAGQRVGAMAEIMLKVIAVGLQHIERLILDFHRVLSQAASSATVSAETARSVTKLL